MKYEDREKLMTEKRSDSSLSHSACQTLLEKRAESLSSKRSRFGSIDPSTNNNDKSLFPMIPLKRGTDNQEVQNLPVKKQATDISNVVPQRLPWKKLHSGLLLEKAATTAATTAETSRETMAEKEVMEEEERRRRTMKAKAEDETQKPRTSTGLCQAMQNLSKEELCRF